MGTNRISGGLVWLLILGVHLTVILAAPSTGHGYETKSFAQAYLECLQYLNITRQPMTAYDATAVPSNTGGNCLMRCIGLNTRWWNDETGLNEKGLVRFFRQPEPNALEQARTCLATVATTSGSCDAAYRTFRCYSDALGEVIAHPEYVAPGRAEIHRAVSDCATILQVSDGQLGACVGAETFLHDGNSTALLRCVVLRLGLYADSTGVLSDRLELLMDSDTALSWTEANAAEAKRCESDLRVLGADVCVVAAHSVEICYGWRAFGALWKVLSAEYGESRGVSVSECVAEPLEESNDAAEEGEQEKKEQEEKEQDEKDQEEKEEQEEKEQEENEQEEKEQEEKEKEEIEQPNNAISPDTEEVEVFYYPSSPRYRSLLLIAPKLIASQSSPTQEDSSSADDKVEAVEETAVQGEDPVNPDNVLKKETTPEPEEAVQKDPETYHVVHTRSVMYPMASEVCPHYSPVLHPYLSRMRRSNPLPHYYPHNMPSEY
uniref:Odorant-binding protein n=1 Tax=Anopheles stephensi TaxID=30069 RepID=A0A182Y7G9_ANOST